ncbi:MAG: transglutaminase family protein [Candidatus Hermodarchaeota archaeon]
MRKNRLWQIAVFLLLIFLLALPPHRVNSFQYFHYWRVTFSGSIEVHGNESLPISSFWNYVGNRSWQTCEQLSFNMVHNSQTIVPTEIGEDIDGNPSLGLEIGPLLEPNDTLQWEEEWLFTVSDRRPSLPQISIEQSGSIEDVEPLIGTEDYLRYTAGTTLWKTWNQSLLDLAQDIREGLPEESQNNILALVYAAIAWIQANITRSTGVTEPQYPEETVVSQMGDCDDQSNLLITLMRIHNIPCYLLTGHWFQNAARTLGYLWGSVEEDAYLYVDWQNSNGHGWAMIYVPPWGWLPFDLIAAEPGSDPIDTYYNSLYATGGPFVTLWQIVASDYIAEQRTEKAELFAHQLHRVEEEVWHSLGSLPIIDNQYLTTNVATILALTTTLTLLTSLVVVAYRRQPEEAPEH